MALHISFDTDKEAVQALEDGLTAYNQAVIGPDVESGPFALIARDDAGKIVGGLSGRIYLDTLHVSILWLDEKLRGEGHGRTLMERAEKEARAKGVNYASLSTLSWQARPFYESLGWKVLGEMPVLSGAHKRYYMWKML